MKIVIFVTDGRTDRRTSTPILLGHARRDDLKRTTCMMMLISHVFIYFQVVLFVALQNQLASTQKKKCPYLRSGFPLRSSPQAQTETDKQPWPP